MGASSFSEFKKNRGNLTEKLQQEMEKGNKSNNEDSRFWQPTRDKNGLASAKIRFLPAPPNEDVAFRRVFDHGFKSKITGKWYIEKSRTTIGEDDPVSDMNRELWNTGIEKNKNIARDRKRRLKYVSNILVVKDPGNPENEGKVFLFRYGKKIFDKLQSCLEPEFEDQKKFDPFDFWEGADFNLRVKTEAVDINNNGSKVNLPNYDDSNFDDPSPVYEGDDEKLEPLWNKEYPLFEFVDPEQFKSYDELKSKLATVLGSEAQNFELFNGGRGTDMEDEPAEKEPEPAVTQTAEQLVDGGGDGSSSTGETDNSLPWSEDDDEEESSDALSYFKSLAEDDD